MKRVLLLATALCVVSPMSYAQQPTKPVPTLAPDTSIKGELDAVFGQLNQQLKQVEGLLGFLKTTQAKNPQELAKQVQTSALELSSLIDRLQQNGDIGGQLAAVRNAAAAHFKRIQDLPKGSLNEADRTSLATTWSSILQNADKAKATMDTMRERLGAALTKLRMRSIAIGELTLAAQYAQAIDAFNRWLGELNSTVEDLHRVLGEPTS